MDKADIRIVVGDQGDGKSNTGTAYAIDDYFANAEAVSPDDKRRCPIVDTYPKYTCRREDGKLIYVPDSWEIESPIKIFANYHLYGVRYVYMELPMMMDYINSPLFTDGWFLIDESFFIDKRNSMTLLGKIMAFFGATIRKRRLHLVIMVQYKSMTELRFRAFQTQTIQCSYDGNTNYITLEIKRKGDKKRQSVSYYAPQYWRYYDTNEINQIPEFAMAKAKEMARATARATE